MPQYKITTLTPVHISSGDEYESSFNLLQDEEYVYIYDEFKIVDFFIKKSIPILSNFNDLKSLIKKNKKEIIDANIHKRRIESNLKVTKPLLSQVESANKPIISGSSIKGAIRTAYIAKLLEDGKFDREIDKLNKIEDKLDETYDYQETKRLKKQKKNLLREINNKINSLTKNNFKYLKISDTLKPYDDSKIYKTINIKKEKSYQSSRKEKVENIANYVECISGENYITIIIESDYFKNLAKVCNDFYQSEYENDFNYYFANKNMKKTINLKNNSFLLNIGRFGGAELKSTEEIRNLNKTGADVPWETSARTFGLSSDGNPPFFENQLTPFGWVLCERIDN